MQTDREDSFFLVIGTVLVSNNFIEPVDNSDHFFSSSSANSGTDTLNRESADLAYFNPGCLGKILGLKGQSQRESRLLRSAGQRYRYHSSRALVEHVMA